MNTKKEMNERPTLWLDLQPEYIDVNFDKFLQYIFDKIGTDKTDSEALKNDVFYLSSISLLHERVQRLWRDLSTKPIGDTLNMGDEAETTCMVRILALFLLARAYDNVSEQHKAMASIALLMVPLIHDDYHEGLLRTAVRAMTTSGRIGIKFGWKDLFNFEPFLFMGLLQRCEMLSDNVTEGAWLAGYGSAVLKDRRLTLLNISESEYKSIKTQKSLTICDESIELRSQPKVKLNQTKTNDYDALESFFNEYMGTMFPTSKTMRRKKHYTKGDSLMVRILRADHDTIEVRTTDKDYEPLSGTCCFDNAFFYTIRDFGNYLMEGCDIPVVLKRDDGDKSLFDITLPFRDFLMDEYYGSEINKQVLARAVEVRNGYMWWWSEYGYSLSTTAANLDVSPGDYAYMTITVKSKEQGYINAEFDYKAELGEFFDDKQSRRDCIESFCYEPEEEADDEVTNVIDENYMRILARILYMMQKTVSLPVERYKILGIVQIMSKMAGDNTSMHYAAFTAKALRNMVHFARGQYKLMEVPDPDPSVERLPSVARRSNIIYILMQYNELTDEAFLNDKIKGDDTLLANLAQLVLSGFRLRQVLSVAMQRQIESEITKQLMVDDEAVTDFTNADANYFGVESDRVEFKTSFIFPPDNHMQANETEQSRNIFRGVCAMLNSRDGGSIYLGVNDHGLGVGLQDDLAHLHLYSIDPLIRHINDSAQRTFGLEMMPYIHITPIGDNDKPLLEIKVNPCDFRIVELDGVAYIRTNAESRKMDDSTRMYILNRKLHFDPQRALLENEISKSISSRHQLLIQNYRSSNGDDRRDRLVEAFAFTKGNKHIWCYDTDDDRVKIFALSRIGSVKISEKPWSHQEAHIKGKIDIFHTTGDTPIHIQLSLDTMAYNLITEEYAESTEHLTSMRDGRWMLDTEVYNLSGIGRFYMGLADHIEIISAPGLKEYVQDKIKSLV